MSESKTWKVYLLRCSDNTLYCGVTNDLSRRLRQHNGELVGGAKYTKYRRPCEVVLTEDFEDKSSAIKREFAIKQLSRAQKLSLLKA